MSGEPGPEPTPSQTIGPFFHDALLERDLTQLVAPDHPRAITISGVVYDGAGDPVTDAMVEISQAGPASSEGNPNTFDGAFSGWGRSGTVDGGRFSFVTLRPAPVPPPDRTPPAPPLDQVVLAPGQLPHVVTRQ